jgi:hypothetical protein
MMVYWRFKGEGPWRFGYRTVVSPGLVRMGYYNGDSTHGPIVSEYEIETRPYQ